MAHTLEERPEYQATMARLEALKHRTDGGLDYWLAREIHNTLGYVSWDGFTPVIDRAKEAMAGNAIDPSHHFVPTAKMMGVGKGAQREGADFFLSRPAMSLIALNGDPSKPEIAAAQAYFVVQTRRMELADEAASQSEDEKRLELRNKVAESFKRVSNVAQEAGVSNQKQAIFHDARYHGLYGMSGREVKRHKGLAEKDNIFDRAGPLELSANDFQMNLAAEVIKTENIRGESRVILKNRDVGVRVRKAMIDSGATLPEHLPLEEPIKEVRKRVGAVKKLPNDPSTA